MARLNTGSTYRVAIGNEHTFIYIDAENKKDLIQFLVDNYAGEHSICGVKRLGFDGMLYPEAIITDPFFKELLAQKRPFPSVEEKPKRISLLCEEYEADDGIREFSVLAVSEDKESLKQLMQAKIQEDEYGYIKSNGVFNQGDTHFTTNFEDGFLEYYILDQDILSRAHIETKVRTTLEKSLSNSVEGEKPSLDHQVKKAATSIQTKTNHLTNSNLER